MKKIILLSLAVVFVSVFISGCDSSPVGESNVSNDTKSNVSNNKNSVGVCSYADAMVKIIETDVLGTESKEVEERSPEKMYKSVKNVFQRSEFYNKWKEIEIPVIVKANGSQLKNLNTDFIVCKLVSINEEGKRSEVIGDRMVFALYWAQRDAYGKVYCLVPDKTVLFAGALDTVSYGAGNMGRRTVKSLPNGKYQVVLYAVSYPDNVTKKVNETVLSTWDFEII